MTMTKLLTNRGLIVFYRKDLLFLNLISRCISSTSEYFLNSKDIVDLCIVNFCARKLFIQCNTGNCCAHITRGVKRYSYVCKYIGPCAFCVCLSVFAVSNHIDSKNHVIHIKLVVNLKLCCIKHTSRCC